MHPHAKRKICGFQCADRIGATHTGLIGSSKILFKGPEYVLQTPFKRKKGEDLTPEQKEYNRELNSERIIIEMMFARLKRFRILRDSNDWSLTELNRTINRVAGLVNLHYLFGFVNPENTHRKGGKPGPKTHRNRNRPDRRERT